MKKFLASLGLLGLINSVGCGSNEEGAPTPVINRLTDAQKAQLKATYNDLGGAIDVSKSAGSGGTGMVVAIANSTDPRAENEARLLEKMGACEVAMPDTSGTNFIWSVGGAQCPVTMKQSVSMSTQQGADSFVSTSQMDLAYELLSEELRKYSDVVAFNFSGKADVSYTQSQMTAQSSLKGTVKSVSKGDIEFFVTESGNITTSEHLPCVRGSAQFTIGVRFADFTGELKQSLACLSGRMEPNGYFVNAEPITKQEYDSYLGRLMSAADLNPYSDDRNEMVPQGDGPISADPIPAPSPEPVPQPE